MINGLMVVGGLVAAIILHEAGHLVSARYFGVAVTDAYLGFGPRLWHRVVGDTTYGIRAIPLGGYVKVGSARHGNAEEQDGTPISPDRLIENLPLPQQMVIYASGVATNMVLAVALLWFVAFFHGITEVVPVIEEVVEGTAATRADLAVGDRLLRIGPVEIAEREDATSAIASRPGQRVDITVERDGGQVNLSGVVLGEREGLGFLGVVLAVEQRRYNLGSSAWWAVKGTAANTALVASNVWRLFDPRFLFDTSDEASTLLTATDRPMSVVGVVKISTLLNGWGVVAMLAMLNTVLAVFNFLPLPPFDGSHVFFAMWRRIVGRDPAQRVMDVLTVAVFTWFVILSGWTTVLDAITPLK